MRAHLLNRDSSAHLIMSDYDFESFSDNEWDDSWEFSWSEFDWERHLKEHDKVLHTYLSQYERFVDRPDRIDEVAHLMGWDQEEWTNDDYEASESAPQKASADKLAGDPEASSQLDPYTVQKHPVYIATRSLFFWVHRAWEFVVPACGAKMPASTALAFNTHLFQAEHYGLLGTQSLDMGDFSLSVCQLKRGLAEINAALHQLQSLHLINVPALEQFQKQSRIRIFDIREIWLRVMRDCREEINRRVGEGEN